MRAATASLFVVLLASTCTSACGGRSVSPVGPTPNPAAPAGVALTPGSYFLGLTGTSETITTPEGGSFSTMVCTFVGPHMPASGRFPITLEPADSGWVARAAQGSLTFTFSADGGGVLGEMSGSAASADGLVNVQVSGQINGTITATDAIAGAVKGQVTFSGAGASTSCSANEWTLSRR
jgi:hypothetical protein